MVVAGSCGCETLKQQKPDQLRHVSSDLGLATPWLKHCEQNMDAWIAQAEACL